MNVMRSCAKQHLVTDAYYAFAVKLTHRKQSTTWSKSKLINKRMN